MKDEGQDSCPSSRCSSLSGEQSELPGKGGCPLPPGGELRLGLLQHDPAGVAVVPNRLRSGLMRAFQRGESRLLLPVEVVGACLLDPVTGQPGAGRDGRPVRGDGLPYGLTTCPEFDGHGHRVGSHDGVGEGGRRVVVAGVQLLRCLVRLVPPPPGSSRFAPAGGCVPGLELKRPRDRADAVVGLGQEPFQVGECPLVIASAASKCAGPVSR